MEKFLIGLAAFIFAFITGYMYGHDFGYEDGKAYQRKTHQEIMSKANKKLQDANNLITRNSLYAR